MEQITSQIARPGTFALATAVFVVTFLLRRVVETVWPDLKAKDDGSYGSKVSLWWNSVILYVIPVLFGCLAAFSKSQWIHGEAETMGARIMWGGGIGWFSSLLYKILRKLIIKHAGVDILPSDPPPANEPKE